MARIVEAQSGTTTSFKITLPRELAKSFLEKNNGCKDINIKPYKNGFIIIHKKEV